MISRHLSQTLVSRFHLARSLYLFGARQTGKTTLIKSLFPQLPYVSIEDPDQEHFASQDPRGFLDQFITTGAVLDEVQRTPDLFRYIQGYIDQYQIKFILSGSQNFLLNQHISQSLSGRVSILELMPLSQREIWGKDPSDQIFNQNPDQVALDQLAERIFLGGYPDPALKPGVAEFWFSDYERTYLERDVRLLINVTDLAKYSQFMRLIAGRSAQILNIASLANDLGFSESGCRKWLSILEASGVVFRLPAYHSNFNKRIIKAPKLYFNDTGLACYLMGIKQPQDLINHAAMGHLFENYIVAEIRKTFINQGKQPPLYFWRDKTGVEIDLIIDDLRHPLGLEIKSGKTFVSDWQRSLQKWLEWSKDLSTQGHIVYGGSDHHISKSIALHCWREC